MLFSQGRPYKNIFNFCFVSNGIWGLLFVDNDLRLWVKMMKFQHWVNWGWKYFDWIESPWPWNQRFSSMLALFQAGKHWRRNSDVHDGHRQRQLRRRLFRDVIKLCRAVFRQPLVEHPFDVVAAAAANDVVARCRSDAFSNVVWWRHELVDKLQRDVFQRRVVTQRRLVFQGVRGSRLEVSVSARLRPEQFFVVVDVVWPTRIVDQFHQPKCWPVQFARSENWGTPGLFRWTNIGETVGRSTCRSNFVLESRRKSCRRNCGVEETGRRAAERQRRLEAATSGPGGVRQTVRHLLPIAGKIFLKRFHLKGRVALRHQTSGF